MEKHASLNGLGTQSDAGLADALRSQLGSDLTPLVYSQPQLAGGVITNADTYAKFLRKLLSGELLMSAALGTHAVCTNPATCSQALNTPVPETESYHYSIGHWVEDDPANGDGAFSSAGAFGFYPWIDASRSYYGVLSRTSVAGAWNESAACGAAIRRAWMSGSAP
jgi:hypothetical protein